MPKVVVTAEVNDPVEWERGFRTHADLFRNRYGVNKPIQFAVIEGNQVSVCFEPDELETYMKGFNAPETAEALAFDGVKRETVKLYILDRELVV